MITYKNETAILQVVYDYLMRPYHVLPGQTITYQPTDPGGSAPSGYTGGTYQYPRLDPSSFALKTMAHPEAEVHEGHAFSVHIYEVAFDKASEIGILFTMPNTLNKLHVVPLVYCGAAAVFDICEAPTVDVANYPTTFYTPINAERNNSNSSGILSVRGTPVVNQASLKLKANAAPITADGTIMHAEMLGSGKQGGGSGRRAEDEIMLKQNTTYYFRLKGSANGADNAAASMQITWYEHIDLE